MVAPTTWTTIVVSRTFIEPANSKLQVIASERLKVLIQTACRFCLSGGRREEVPEEAPGPVPKDPAQGDAQLMTDKISVSLSC